MAAPININANLNLNPASINASAKQVQQALGRITGQASEFQKSLDASTARVFAFGATTAVINGVNQAFKSLVSTTINVQAKLTEINSILGAGAAEFNNYRNSIFKVAKETGQSFNTVAQGAAELARQGLGATESAKRLEAALILTRISGLGAEQSVKALTAAMNGFTSAGLSAEQIVNKIVAVDTAFAVSAQDLADGFSRAGSTAEDAGVSFEQLLGLITAVEQRTARGGAVIGNAFKSIFTRISRGSTIDSLQELGVAIDANQNGVQKLQSLSKALEEISDPSKVSAIKELAGGVFQINVVSAALKDLGSDASVFAEATKTGMNAANEATEKNTVLNSTLLAQINSLTVTVTSLASKLGNLTISPLLQDIVGVASSLTKKLDDALDPESGGSKFIEGFFKVIGNFLAGPGLAIFTVAFAKIFGTVVKFAKDGFKTVMQMGSATERIKNIEGGIIGLLQKDEILRKAIGDSTTTQAQKEQAILAAIKKENALLTQQRDLVASIAASSRNAGVKNFDSSSGLFSKKGGKRYASGGGGQMEPDLMTALVNESRDAPAGASPYVTNFRGSPAVMNTSEMQVSIGGREEILTAGQIPRFNKGSSLKADRKRALNRDGKFIMMHGEQTGYKLNRFYMGQSPKNPSKAGQPTKNPTENNKTLVNVPTYGVPTDKKNFGDINSIVDGLKDSSVNEAIKVAKRMSNGVMPKGKEGIIKGAVSKQINEGTVKAFAGNIQEMGLASLLTDDKFKDYTNQSTGSTFDLDLSGQKALKGFYKVRRHKAQTGEVKGSGNDGLAGDTARKIFRVSKLGESIHSHRNEKGMTKPEFKEKFPNGVGPKGTKFQGVQSAIFGKNKGKLPTLSQITSKFPRNSKGTISNSRLASKTGISRFAKGSKKQKTFGPKTLGDPKAFKRLVLAMDQAAASSLSLAKSETAKYAATQRAEAATRQLASATNIQVSTAKNAIEIIKKQAAAEAAATAKRKNSILGRSISGTKAFMTKERSIGGGLSYLKGAGKKAGGSIKGAMGGMGGGFGLSMVATGLSSAAEKLASEGKSAESALLSAAGSTANFAATGLMLGGPIGALVGTIVGLGKSIYDSNEKLKEAEKIEAEAAKPTGGMTAYNMKTDILGDVGLSSVDKKLKSLAESTGNKSFDMGPKLKSLSKQMSKVVKGTSEFDALSAKFEDALYKAKSALEKGEALPKLIAAREKTEEQIIKLMKGNAGKGLSEQLAQGQSTNNIRTSLLSNVEGPYANTLRADQQFANNSLKTGAAEANLMDLKSQLSGAASGSEEAEKLKAAVDEAGEKFKQSVKDTATSLVQRRFDVNKRLLAIDEKRKVIADNMLQITMKELDLLATKGPLDLGLVGDLKDDFKSADSDMDKVQVISAYKGRMKDAGFNDKMIDAAIAKVASPDALKKIMGSGTFFDTRRGGKNIVDEFEGLRGYDEGSDAAGKLDVEAAALKKELGALQGKLEKFGTDFKSEGIVNHIERIALSLDGAGRNFDKMKVASDSINAVSGTVTKLATDARAAIEEQNAQIANLRARAISQDAKIKAINDGVNK
jgi:TP901 family phage tail tape measure protein